MALPSSTTSVSETMARLSSKSGVIATLAIERTTSTVLQHTGTLGAMFSSTTSSSLSASTNTVTSPAEREAPVVMTAEATEEQAFSDFAKMVWNHVNATGELVGNMDAEDELKLLRLRTKKHELVIVPDAKFLFVVVHDVPSA
ncbi:uncharacterized protein RSE6_11946 [Rhynchosporium secalis]|uniref:Roadblock/LAMTOR2 domain-containing protein n=1 Tax=Rhynchosporium secalis TaxID=38038 RepID=A0A1E1MP58_RHYSE|nr:uncharacterized protein RSE6_11946 [Rhynchosporium secalis]